MSFDSGSLPDDIEELKRIIANQNNLLEERNAALRDYSIEVKILKEKVTLLQSRLFSKKSEKLGPIEQRQALLFNEIETLHDSHPELPLDEEPVIVTSPQRNKKRKKRIPDDLERREEIIDIPETEKLCSCGSEKARIGEEVCEKIEYIPAEVFVRKIIRPKYACRQCYGADDEGQPVAIAPVKPSLLGKSILSEGIFGHMIVSKFADSLPFYRQEVIFRRAGIEISRKTMAMTAIRVAQALSPLQSLLYRQINEASVIGIDETVFQVLKEPNKRADQLSYLWHILAHTREGPVPLFFYRSNRSSAFLTEILSDYKGAIVTDGYNGYNILQSRREIVHAGCNAHARRKFIEAGKVVKGNADIDTVLELYRQIYKIESDWRESHQDLKELARLRDKQTRPLMVELKNIISKQDASYNPSGHYGSAIKYTLNIWPQLTAFLDSPEIPIDNNQVENGIRPFVVGRKNWLFAVTTSGAHASALFYTLIEGSKAAGLNPSLYMHYLLKNASVAVTEADWEALLPLKLKNKDFLLAE